MRATSFVLALAAVGCFPATNGSSDGGGSYGYSSPTLELTVNGVHFGPSAPDPGAAADLVVTRDATTGRATSASFRLQVSAGSAGCALAFDRYGDGATLGVGQYSVSSAGGSATADGTVYPPGAEHFSTPAGGASCTGSSCDGAAFVLTAVDAAHATGYFQGTAQADSGAGVASVVCSFYVPTRSFRP